MESLLQEITSFYDILNFEKIIEWYQKNLKKIEEHRIKGFDFNVFNLLSSIRTIQETHHSKFLSYLLDPNEKHGFGNKFLYEFIAILNEKYEKKILWKEGSHWKVFTEKHTSNGNIDIILQRDEPETIIIIENKVNGARDQKNQLYRYWKEIIYEKTKNIDKNFYKENVDKYRIVYLTYFGYETIGQTLCKPNDCYKNEVLLPDKAPIVVDNWSFKGNYDSPSIYHWLEECKKHIKSDTHRIKDFINQYQEFFNTNTSDMLQKAKELFECRNPEKWNAFVCLVEQKGNIENEWWKKLIFAIVEKWKREYLTKDNKKTEWNIYCDGSHIRFFIKDMENLSIYLSKEEFSIWGYSKISGNRLTQWKNNNEEKINGIKSLFCIAEDFRENYLCKEYLYFNNNETVITNPSELAWYAGNKTEEFANQLLEKIQKLQTVEITELFEEINKECKAQ